jgi:uncharacterized protein involved in type VI secretion and phage assembly
MSGVLDQITDERLENLKRLRFGLYRGIVRDVDDPEEKGRVRVEVHELLGAGRLTNWASYCAPFGGGGAGFFMLPRPGDGVWVMFERGEPTRPVWIGFWFNAEDARPAEAGKEVRVLRSKSGHQIALGDEDGKEFLEVKDKAGNVVRIDSPSGDLTVKVSGKAQVEVGGDATVKSGGDVTVEASGRATVKAGGPVTLDAPRVKTTGVTYLAGGGRRVARVGDLVMSRGHLVQVGHIRTGAAKTSAS